MEVVSGASGPLMPLAPLKGGPRVFTLTGRELVRELFGLNHFRLITSGRGPYRDTLAGNSSSADERVAVTLALNLTPLTAPGN
jgi:hypothetical protein